MHRTIAAAALALLAGCGQAEDAFRNSYRESSIESCTSASRTAAPPQFANFDWGRLCTCATDRLMAGKSVNEIRQLQSNTPEQRAALEQCIAEIAGPNALNAPPAGDGNKLTSQ